MNKFGAFLLSGVMAVSLMSTAAFAGETEAMTEAETEVDEDEYDAT